MWRRPILQVLDGKGTNILSRLDGLWKEVSVTDGKGGESDEASIVIGASVRQAPPPQRGDPYTVLMGWADEGPVLQGRYTVQNSRARGEPGSGEGYTIKLRAGDYVDKLKAAGRKHFDEGTTFGELVAHAAKAAGVPPAVDPELAKIKLGFRLQWDQSLIDFVAEVGEELGAVVKPMGGKLAALRRGEGKAAGGAALETIHIRRRASYGYDVQVEPRPQYGNVAAGWHDGGEGRRKLVKEKTGREGPIIVLPHPFRSEEEARRAARALSYELGNLTGDGTFESPGLPRARAEAPVIAEGFGPGIDGRWVAESVTKTIDPSGGFKTTVTVKAGKDEKGKPKGKKDG